MSAALFTLSGKATIKGEHGKHFIKRNREMLCLVSGINSNEITYTVTVKSLKKEVLPPQSQDAHTFTNTAQLGPSFLSAERDTGCRGLVTHHGAGSGCRSRRIKNALTGPREGTAPEMPLPAAESQMAGDRGAGGAGARGSNSCPGGRAARRPRRQHPGCRGRPVSRSPGGRRWPRQGARGSGWIPE